MEVHTTFSKRHVGLLVALLLFVGNNLILYANSDNLNIVSNLIIAGVLGIDIVFAYFNFFHKFNFLVVFRFVEIVVVGALIKDHGVNTLSDANQVFSVLFYALLSIETMLLFDLSEYGNTIKVSLLCQIPFGFNIVKVLMEGKDDYVYHAINYLFISIVTFMILHALAIFYGKIQDYYDKSLFAKDRMLDRAKDNSDKADDSKKSTMLVNEQLGIKKYELEMANQRVNEANADIILQNKFLSIMTSSLSLEDTAKDTKVAFMEAFDLCFCGLLFKNKKLREKYDSGINKLLKDIELDMFMDFFLSYAFIHEHRNLGDNYFNNEVDYDEFPYFEKAGIRSVAIKTIESDNKDHICIYVLFSKKSDAFKGRENVLNNIFGQMEVVSANLSMYKQIEEMSVRDGLTNLYNRRYLNLYYQNNFVDVKPKGSVSVVMLDIDHFKHINDTYGHLFGDLAIKTISGIIKEYAEEYDGNGFRYGGEEFVLIFEDKNLEDTLSIVEKMISTVRSTKIESDSMSSDVRVSIGVTAYPYLTDEINLLVDRADKAMYHSKENGRDQITIDGRF